MIIPSTWRKAIKDCLQVSSAIKSNVVLLDPKQIFLNSTPGEIDVNSYFVPPIFIWDPVTVSKNRFPILCPLHHTEIFETGLWLDNSDNSRSPRILIDVSGPMLLVGRLYKCKAGDHFVRTTDEKLLAQCGSFAEDVVFTHKCSYKQEFIQTMCQYVVNGLTFPRIVELLKDRCKAICQTQWKKYQADCLLNKVEPDASKYGEILEKCLKMLPEADCLEDFFKGWFRKNEQYFVDCMGSLSATVLTVDHTFKVYNFDSFFFYLNFANILLKEFIIIICTIVCSIIMTVIIKL